MSKQAVKQGHEVLMNRIPTCDVDATHGPAKFDSRLPKLGGSWGYVCGMCFHTYGPGVTGVGSAQKLIKRRD